MSRTIGLTYPKGKKTKEEKTKGEKTKEEK